jgi:hypothetical protein
VQRAHLAVRTVLAPYVAQLAELAQFDKALVEAWLEAVAHIGSEIHSPTGWFLAGVRSGRLPGAASEPERAQAIRLAERYLRNAGLLRTMQPAVLGGFELPLDEAVRRRLADLLADDPAATNGKLYDGTGIAGHLIVAGDLPYALTGTFDKATYQPNAGYFGPEGPGDPPSSLIQFFTCGPCGSPVGCSVIKCVPPSPLRNPAAMARRISFCRSFSTARSPPNTHTKPASR